MAEVQGGGRVLRYRHYMYEWLGVDKVEIAVMTELLLRGTQTEGELRGRAARMEPIADVAALRPVLTSLKTKGLVISLTSEGRGHVVTHALYEPRELEKQRAEFGGEGTPHESPAVPNRERPHVAEAPASRAMPPAEALRIDGSHEAGLSSAAAEISNLKRDWRSFAAKSLSFARISMNCRAIFVDGTLKRHFARSFIDRPLPPSVLHAVREPSIDRRAPRPSAGR